ncbi:cation diffusion facilitator family transporter [Kineococcus glutinatus]
MQQPATPPPTPLSAHGATDARRFRGGTRRRLHELPGPQGGESGLTVLLAFGANLLVAVAKSVAALVTGSAAMVAEAAHSWADAGNEVFLVIAHRRGARPADDSHPWGYGRAVYVWSMFAALGLFAAGAAVSVTHGVQSLLEPEEAGSYLVGYLVLGVAFVLEGISFLQSLRQAHAEAGRLERDVLDHVLATSDPTLRAVFFEDAAALAGLVIAAAALLAHQLTGSPVPDAVGSILVGVLLGVVAVVLIRRNMQFIVGQEADPRVRAVALRTLLDMPGVARVTYLRLEYVGPRVLSVVGDVDLAGDERESDVAVRLRALEAELVRSPAVAGAVLSLSAPDEPSLVP